MRVILLCVGLVVASAWFAWAQPDLVRSWIGFDPYAGVRDQLNSILTPSASTGATARQEVTRTATGGILLKNYVALSQLDPSIYKWPAPTGSYETRIPLYERDDTIAGQIVKVPKAACLATVYVMVERGNGRKEFFVDDAYQVGVGAVDTNLQTFRPGAEEAIRLDEVQSSLRRGVPVVLGGERVSTQNNADLTVTMRVVPHYVLAVGFETRPDGVAILILDPWGGYQAELNWNAGGFLASSNAEEGKFTRMRSVLAIPETESVAGAASSTTSALGVKRDILGVRLGMSKSELSGVCTLTPSTMMTYPAFAPAPSQGFLQSDGMQRYRETPYMCKKHEGQRVIVFLSSEVTGSKVVLVYAAVDPSLFSKSCGTFLQTVQREFGVSGGLIDNEDKGFSWERFERRMTSKGEQAWKLEGTAILFARCSGPGSPFESYDLILMDPVRAKEYQQQSTKAAAEKPPF